MLKPGAARTRLLDQHERLRALLHQARGLATRFSAGEPVGLELDACLDGLRAAFAEHNQYELRVLEPVLRDADDWGPARVARMMEEHAAEHAVLTALLAGRLADVVPRLADFADEIDAHMAAEERTFLSPAVLRDDDGLGVVRERLNTRRRELLHRYQQTRELADEELDSREIEAEENAAELWDARVLSALGDVEHRTLTAVIDALRRLDAGTYGRCVACGEAIEPERLAALAEADRCLACALAR